MSKKTPEDCALWGFRFVPYGKFTTFLSCLYHILFWLKCQYVINPSIVDKPHLYLQDWGGTPNELIKQFEKLEQFVKNFVLHEPIKCRIFMSNMEETFRSRNEKTRINTSFLAFTRACWKADDGTRTRDLLTTNEVRYHLCHISVLGLLSLLYP